MERKHEQSARQRRGKAEKQTPRTIRFYDRDWDRIETFAVMRGMSAAELVRVAVLAAVGDGSPGIETGGRDGRLIERMFRYTHILATALRNDMVAQGRAGELEELVRSARELQDTLRDGSPD